MLADVSWEHCDCPTAASRHIAIAPFHTRGRAKYKVEKYLELYGVYFTKKSVRVWLSYRTADGMSGSKSCACQEKSVIGHPIYVILDRSGRDRDGRWGGAQLGSC